MRIDSHQHFWQYNTTDYVWMSSEMNVLRQDYLPETLIAELKTVGFDGTVAVQARQMVKETQWLLELADKNDFIKAVVGWVDFESPNLDEQLERFASHKKLKGIRELIHDMPDVNYATSHVHTSAIAKLAKYGLTYDLLLKPPHIRPAIDLVRQFPEQLFVVDHIAKPAIAKGEIEPWKSDIQKLATCDNVYCKLSGMVTEAKWGDWKPDDFRPYLDVVIEAFGPGRLMIGSDWPVCRLSASYAEAMGIVTDYIGALSPDEQAAILGGTCSQFYSLSH